MAYEAISVRTLMVVSATGAILVVRPHEGGLMQARRINMGTLRPKNTNTSIPCTIPSILMTRGSLHLCLIHKQKRKMGFKLPVGFGDHIKWMTRIDTKIIRCIMVHVIDMMSGCMRNTKSNGIQIVILRQSTVGRGLWVQCIIIRIHQGHVIIVPRQEMHQSISSIATRSSHDMDPRIDIVL